jgi:hypothetical protein
VASLWENAHGGRAVALHPQGKSFSKRAVATPRTLPDDPAADPAAEVVQRNVGRSSLAPYSLPEWFVDPPKVRLKSLLTQGKFLASVRTVITYPTFDQIIEPESGM